MFKPQAAEYIKGHHTALWALQYTYVQLIVVVAVSLICAFAGEPPWTLDASGPWTLSASRLSLWVSLASGLADILNGDMMSTYRNKSFTSLYCTAWIISVITQVVVVSVRNIQPSAKAIVALACHVIMCIVHVALASPREWPCTLVAAVIRAQSTLRYGFQSLLLLFTLYLHTSFSLQQTLLYVIGFQAIWQFHTWYNGLHSSLLQSFGLYTAGLLISQAVSVHFTWIAGALGWGHAATAVFTFVALSNAIYEPRTSLPFKAEDVNMRLWCVSSFRLSRSLIIVLVQVASV
jgi:hypothetical protein